MGEIFEISWLSLEQKEESIYSVGNNTDNVIQLTEKAGGVIARATELVSGGESVAALSKIAFKITKDVIRSDDVCAELCLISGACQTVALCCSTIKVIPFWSRFYVSTKIISKDYMTFRNAYAVEGC